MGSAQYNRRQRLLLQLLSFLSAASEVANLGALMPFLHLLAKTQDGTNDLGLIGAQLYFLPDKYLLLSLGILLWLL